MLSAIDRYNAIGACQIVLVESERRPNFRFNRDTTHGRNRQGILGGRPDVAHPELQRKTTRDGPPVKIKKLGTIIDQ